VGFVLSDYVSGAPSIGASGSIFGLLAALIVYGRKRGGSIMTNQLWQWAAFMFVFGFFMSGVNNWAHLGGFAGGWVTAEAMRFSEKRESRGVQIFALGLLGLTGVGFVLSFTKVTSILLTH
jgi:rhomboid protease GluP